MYATAAQLGRKQTQVGVNATWICIRVITGAFQSARVPQDRITDDNYIQSSPWMDYTRARGPFQTHPEGARSRAFLTGLPKKESVP